MRGLRIAANGCGVAGNGSLASVSAFRVNAAGNLTLTNTAAAGTSPRYGAITCDSEECDGNSKEWGTSPRYGAITCDGTLAAFGGFGTQFTLFRLDAACAPPQIGVDTAGLPAASSSTWPSASATGCTYRIRSAAGFACSRPARRRSARRSSPPRRIMRPPRRPAASTCFPAFGLADRIFASSFAF